MHKPAPLWAVVLILGAAACTICFIAAKNGYSLRFNSHVIEVEMRPGTQAPPVPQRGP